MTLSPISQKTLRKLLNSDKHFKWTETHQKVFNNVLNKFKKETLLSYFNILKPILKPTCNITQGSDKDKAKPVAFASRCTSKGRKELCAIRLRSHDS